MVRARGTRSKTEKIDPTAALQAINQAVDIRKEISALYSHYSLVSKAIKGIMGIEPRIFKKAVDATYYFGGGWPNPESPGRLESFLDSFTEMYKFLDFIGEGKLVEEHLAENGITVKLKAGVKHRDRKLTTQERGAVQAILKLKKVNIGTFETLREFATACHNYASSLQGDICGLADQVNFGLKPAAMEHLKLAPPEYNRLFAVTSAKRKTNEAAGKRVKKFGVSLNGYKAGLDELSKPAPKT